MDVTKINKAKLNLIVSSCGTGKTYFCANGLLEKLPDIRPCEVIFVTSRSITVDQQTVMYNEKTQKFKVSDTGTISAWNGFVDISVISAKGIQVMTYDKLIHLILNCGVYGWSELSNVRMIVFDECHALFTDTFINNMELLKFWIYVEMQKSQKIFIGLTATPKIVYESSEHWGVGINDISPNLIRYKAQNLWLTNSKSLVQLIENELTGKTIIMCNSTQMCYKLEAQLQKAKVLVSRNNDAYVPYQMDMIRDYIINKGELPSTVDILITTSTLREGFGFREGSNIKNVITFLTDETHVTQFLGRCRFNVKNLVVVDSNMRKSGIDYIDKSRERFRNFFNSLESSEWFDDISPLISCKRGDTKLYLSEESKASRGFVVPSRKKRQYLDKYNSEAAISNFIKYINDVWLVDENNRGRAICGDSDKNEIVDVCKSIQIIGPESNDLTFRKVMGIIRDLGYEIKENRPEINGKRVRCKTIHKKERKELEINHE